MRVLGFGSWGGEGVVWLGLGTMYDVRMYHRTPYVVLEAHLPSSSGLRPMAPRASPRPFLIRGSFFFPRSEKNLWWDASLESLGAILEQKNRVVRRYSRL